MTSDRIQTGNTPLRSNVSNAPPSLPPLSTTRHLLLFGLTALLLFGCRKDELISDDPGAKLVLTEDTILFDTVFTTVGSVTKRFTVRNENTNAVLVDVTLQGGTPSPFRINVDGASGISFNDVEILGGDSIFIFVEATLGESGSNDPFIIEDRIVFNTNGNGQTVLLNAWGQDAHFIRTDTVFQGLPPIGFIARENENVQWVNDKPYVIYGCYGLVDEGGTLTIDPGVRVYFHGTGSGLWVFSGGSIQALGGLNDRITFQGDRLEAFYDDLPNQWDRIWINEGSQENRFENCEIKNALIGLQAQTFPLTPGQPLSDNTLVLNNVSIKNCATAGLYAENYRIKSTNLLVGDAGQYSVVLTGSGEYNFNHTTVGNYWSFEIRQDPAFFLSNRFTDVSGEGQVRPIETSTFTNGIIYGSNANEFLLDLDAGQSTPITFSNYQVRTDQNTSDTNIFTDIFRNQDPGFVDASEGDFHLSDGSSTKSRATAVAGDALFDLDGRDRPNTSVLNDFLPDLGCFEQYD